MLKLRSTLSALMAIVCSFVFASALQATQPKAAPYNDHPPYNLHEEKDKTDIFAIPLDSSEEEQNEELEELEEGYPPKK